MASREVKPAMSSKAPERGAMPTGKVRAAMAPAAEERPKKTTRKPKRAMGR
jgi:hypothetical protein